LLLLLYRKIVKKEGKTDEKEIEREILCMNLREESFVGSIQRH